MRLRRGRSVILLALVAAAPAAAQDAPMFRGDPTHSGVYAGPALSRTLRIKWRFHTSGDVIASPAGRWRFPTEGRITSSPAVADGVVYFVSYDRAFYAVDAGSGKQRWKFETEGERRFAATHLHGAIPKAEVMLEMCSISATWTGSCR